MSAQTTNSIEQGWNNATHFNSNQAQIDFKAARKTAPSTSAESREVDFGEAVSLLNVQPKTDGNLDRAAALLQSIRKANANDDLGIASLYFLARIEQYQRLPPNLTKATEYYRDLVRDHPHHFWGEQAAIRLAMLDTYRLTTAAEQMKLLAVEDQAAAQFVDPLSRRDMYAVLAQTYLNLQLSPQKALDDLLKTQEVGFSFSLDRADSYVRIGELARSTGRNDIAILYYKKLIGEFPFDIRVYTIKEKLASMAASPALTKAHE